MEESLQKDNKRQRTEDDKSTLFPIKSLPTDLLLNVVAKVSSESCIDHYNMKVCCRDFLHATKDNYMWQQISLEKFSLISWSCKEKARAFDIFMQSCKESGNIEALYREGLREIIRYKGNIEKGINDLKMAAKKGYLEAKYVYGLILLCSYDSDLRKEGVEYMQFLKNLKCVVRCRNKVVTLLGNLWRKPYGTLVRNSTPLCSERQCNGWNMKKCHSWKIVDSEDDDNNIKNSCENCRWDF
ncbi:F-box protein At2g35280-like [Vigna umbellata]|uniref:F-box protein At2g35280-like n=1 Tax=Vigna umbellata TaxID=87088 RepID=UPI001F5E5DBB|nr:F-box protein At2g35280-like [Vigna umbellata]